MCMSVLVYVMCFRKPWLKVKSVDFDFSAKSSSTVYNETNKPTPKFPAHTGSEKSRVDLRVPKMSFSLFSDISERNNDYSDTLDFRRG